MEAVLAAATVGHNSITTVTGVAVTIQNTT